MIICSGQLRLLYFEKTSIRLGEQTCLKTFGFHFCVCVSLFIYGTWIIFLSANFIHASSNVCTC
jgi:hypothetical protein